MKNNKKHHHHAVEPIDLEKIDSINDMTRQFAKSGVFGAGTVGKAVDILFEAEREGASFFVGLAGAMVPGGMRKVIVQGIKDGRIHALTTTGANITHDLIEAFGGSHVKDVMFKNDFELRERGIDRVYDAFVAEGSFETFEDHIKELLNQLLDKSEDRPLIITPSELLNFIGSKIDDPHSIVKTAYDHNVPIFVPAISDSVLGLQIWLFSQFHKFVIDATKDLHKIQDMFHESEVNCALLLGGGVPKNFTLQAALMASRHYQYAIQITMDRVETGGLSGASLEEAISWGKLEPDAKTVTIIGDITIVLPIIYTALRQRNVSVD